MLAHASQGWRGVLNAPPVFRAWCCARVVSRFHARHGRTGSDPAGSSRAWAGWSGGSGPRGGWRRRRSGGRERGDTERWRPADRTRPQAGQPPALGRAEQAVDEDRRCPGRAQRTDRLDAPRRHRSGARGRLDLHGPRQEDAQARERRHARVVDCLGRGDQVHDRRPGAVRREEGLHGAGALSQLLPDGDGGRHAVAAARSQRGQPGQDLPA